ncbi:Aspartate aminotransferase [Pseudomonas sp. 22 E 5]|nr:Aspartate aminotransferase [Pseudomonas sp. 22 E 5]
MKPNRLAPRMALVRSSPTAEISNKVRALEEQGKDVINLGEGELAFDTPDHIKQAGIAAIQQGQTKYTAVEGTAELLRAVVEKFETENGIRYSTAEVIAGAGAKQLIFNAFLATISSGDEVLITAPYWVSYPDIVALAEGSVRILPCNAAGGWKINPEALEAAISPNTRWLVLNSPNNPSGAVYSETELRALADVLIKHPHVLVMADDIYEHVRYEGAFYTPAQIEPRLRDRTLTINGLSKGYSMTGWRLGFAGGPAWLISAMQVLQSQSTSNPSSISQAAAVAALRGNKDFLAGWIEELGRARELLLRTIERSPGLICEAAEGAFYAFVNCEGVVGAKASDGRVLQNDLDFANYLLEVAHVGVMHGEAFGVPNHIRIAYGVDQAKLQEACLRIEKACKELSFTKNVEASR